MNLLKLILSLPPHQNVVVPKHMLRLEDLPVRRTLGELIPGKIADYEITLKDGRRIHILEFEDYYLIHWDRASPYVDPIKHLKEDAPHWYAVIESIIRLIKYKFF